MISIFHDSVRPSSHGLFQKWRLKNPAAFFINKRSSNGGMIHTSECAHVGDTQWTEAQFSASLTDKMKICSHSVEELAAWAQTNNISITSCQHCEPDLLSDAKLHRRAFLVTWNPNNWHWKKLIRQIAELKAQGYVDEPWTCKTSQVEVGDRVFLLRQGPDKPGMVASGIATSRRKEGVHYSDNSKQSGYINVRWDTVLNADEEEILTRLTLKQNVSGGKLWDIQGSGVSIPPKIALLLEKAWSDLLIIKQNSTERGPDEIPPSDHYWEGAVRQVTVNAYERDLLARKACIEHYGAKCQACKMNFEQVYGAMGKGFIHVHHVRPLSSIRKGYKVDPVKDLRPVCPNCHAMIHRHSGSPMTVEDLAAMLKKSSGR